MTLGENILKLRKKQGLSQEQLGYQIDVTRYLCLGCCIVQLPALLK